MLFLRVRVESDSCGSDGSSSWVATALADPTGLFSNFVEFWYVGGWLCCWLDCPEDCDMIGLILVMRRDDSLLSNNTDEEKKCEHEI